MPFLSETIRRFESKFTKGSPTDCWEWIATKPGGRARFYYGKEQYAARMSFRIYRGEIPKGILVCHTCDNPRCVNPSHLFLGTSKDNVQDMVTKGRTNPEKGEDRHCAKLTEKEVR